MVDSKAVMSLKKASRELRSKFLESICIKIYEALKNSLENEELDVKNTTIKNPVNSAGGRPKGTSIVN